MNRVLPFAALSILTAVACSSAAPEDEAPASTDQDVSTTLPNLTEWAKGTNWSYERNFVGLPKAWVYTPRSFSKKAPDKRAVIFHLPGCGELAYQVAQGSGWPQVAEDNGFVVVVPEVIDPAYPNPAAPHVGCYDFGLITQATRYRTDHAALIKAGSDIAKKKPELKIDPRQIYIAGLSAGATTAMQVACMAPEVFAGVGSVAGPSLGTFQAAAVMPPVWGPEAVRWGCSYYADESPADNAKEMLGKQIYAIASDDNGLPAGIPILEWGVWTATEFVDPDYWDGDKYIPFAHHRIIADAMAGLFDAKLASEDVPVPGLTGIGYGCVGGEKSHDDTAETKCNVSDYKKRPWQVKADTWTDKQGRKRIVHLKQDTLRHRWPVGPLGPLDRPVTPTFPDLVAQGYMDQHAQVNVAKVAGAPSGTFGVGFFGDDTFNFTKYLAEFLTENNPRL
jgi:poly(hydroxyalkanoate) depolymerase family esterase